MKKTFRFLSAVLCIAMIAALFAAIPAFAEGKPGPDDLKDAGKYVYGPKSEDSWLDEYQTGYICPWTYTSAVYTYCTSTIRSHYKTVDHGTEVTLLAKEHDRYLAKTEDGRAFWVFDLWVTDHYVAPGRIFTNDPEVDANGPGLNDIKGMDSEVYRPGCFDWLDKTVDCYVYAPKNHLGAEMLYYSGKPTDDEALKKGYDGNRNMGSIKQGSPITLLAHHGDRYLAKNEGGAFFWIYDWCVSDTLVPYGEAK